MSMLKQHLKRFHILTDKQEIKNLTGEEESKSSVHKTYLKGKLPAYPYRYCEECDKTFFSDVAMRSHNAYSHRNEPVTCSVCQKEVKNQATLYQHYRNKHKLRNKEDIKHVEMGGSLESLGLPEPEEDQGFNNAIKKPNEDSPIMFPLSEGNNSECQPLASRTPFNRSSVNDLTPPPERAGPYIPYTAIGSHNSSENRKEGGINNKDEGGVKEEKKSPDVKNEGCYGDVKVEVKLETEDVDHDDYEKLKSFQFSMEESDDCESDDGRDEDYDPQSEYKLTNPKNCPICKKSISNLKDLKKHFIEYHGLKNERDPNEDTEVEMDEEGELKSGNVIVIVPCPFAGMIN